MCMNFVKHKTCHTSIGIENFHNEPHISLENWEYPINAHNLMSFGFLGFLPYHCLWKNFLRLHTINLLISQRTYSNNTSYTILILTNNLGIQKSFRFDIPTKCQYFIDITTLIHMERFFDLLVNVFFIDYSRRSHPLTFYNHMQTKFASPILYAIDNFKIYDISPCIHITIDNIFIFMFLKFLVIFIFLVIVLVQFESF